MRARHTGLDKPRALQRVLYRAAKEDAQRRFHSLYDKVARSDVLAMGWEQVRANRGAPGVDGVSVEGVEASGVDRFLNELAHQLRSNIYRPKPLRRVHIPKPGSGKTRPLGIPTVADRTVMAAARWVLEPIFEAGFLDTSFGFRPRRSAHQAVEAVRQAANVATRGDWVLDADLAGCFDNISHAALMGQVSRRVCDRRMLALIRSWLRAGVMEGATFAETVSGTPQGSPISPLLANVALHVLDEAWATHGRRLGVLTRYADDFVIVCPTEERAIQARELAAEVLAGLGLAFNADKTRVVCLREGRDGFDFLGFHFRKVESHRWRGRWYCQRWPSKKAMATIRATLRTVTSRPFVGHSVADRVEVINPILRGWGNYFAPANSARAFKAIDRYAYERLALFASKKHGRRGRGWNGPRDWAWYSCLGVYQLSGRVAWGSPHAVR